MEIGQKKHKIYVVGMGPGKEEMMTNEAIAALEASDVIIGYTAYITDVIFWGNALLRKNF